MKNKVYKVPENDKEIFVSPAINDCIELILSNIKIISKYNFEISGVPFQVLRDKTRSELLQKAELYTNKIISIIEKEKLLDDLCEKRKGCNFYINYKSLKNNFIIQTGHEPILYHPGVWIKNHLTNYLTRKTGGIGINMIVDNDACNMGYMCAPNLFSKPPAIEKIQLVVDKNKLAYEEILFNDIKVLTGLKEDNLTLINKNMENKNVENTIEDMKFMFEEYINNVMIYYKQGCVDMVSLLTCARKILEKEFGIYNLEIPVSLMSDSDSFNCFILHFLCNAERFAKIYNEKLAEYRNLHKIRSKVNPLPDLHIEDNLFELPFWIWKTGEPRCKCYVINGSDTINITDGSDVLITLEKNGDISKNIYAIKDFRGKGIKIRPRAVTNTMFSRLFFADVFIHGIGGAKYDVITDEVIKEFFGIEPPSYITVSATLFLPFGKYETDKKALRKSKYIIKDMKYNPERYASAKVKNNPDYLSLVEEKRNLLKMIDTCDKEEKNKHFYRIKELNGLLLTYVTTEIQERYREMNKICEDIAYNNVVKFREYPIFIYPKRILKEYFQKVFS
ncbi:MAG TPA: hypothetical protein ACFYEE_10010 [Candidatus Wujingus californicus]|uniref:hypothetical protein n=1 Tax=Candidatus Wujingus californicus TaxID=3367618 RepID=UPI004024C476